VFLLHPRGIFTSDEENSHDPTIHGPIPHPYLRRTNPGHRFGHLPDRPGLPAKPSGKTTIVVIPKGTSHEYWKSVEAGANEAGKDLNVDIIYRGTLSEDDHAGEMRAGAAIHRG